eukprot:937710-Rhodomonas_salina.1
MNRLVFTCGSWCGEVSYTLNCDGRLLRSVETGEAQNGLAYRFCVDPAETFYTSTGTCAIPCVDPGPVSGASARSRICSVVRSPA